MVTGYFRGNTTCPDFDVEIYADSPMDDCGYAVYLIEIKSFDSDLIKGADINISMDVGGFNSVFFDQQGTLSNKPWLILQTPVSTAFWSSGLIPFGGAVQAKDIRNIGTMTICGRQTGSLSFNVQATLIDENFNQCTYTNTVTPSITWPSVVNYTGVIQKQPLNCSNSNSTIEGVTVELAESRNSDAPISNNTGILGTYIFGTTPAAFAPLQNQCYTICPSKGIVNFCSINQNDQNRVQSFVLGQYCPTYAWEKLAMDVSNDDEVSTKDVVIIFDIINNNFDYTVDYWRYWKFLLSLQYNAMAVNCTEIVPPHDECIDVKTSATTQNDGWYGVISGDADGSCTTCSFDRGSQTRNTSPLADLPYEISRSHKSVFITLYTSALDNLWSQGIEFKINVLDNSRILIKDKLEDADNVYFDLQRSPEETWRANFLQMKAESKGQKRRLFTLEIQVENLQSQDLSTLIEILENEDLNGIWIQEQHFQPNLADIGLELIDGDKFQIISQPNLLYIPSLVSDGAVNMEVYSLSGQHIESLKGENGVFEHSLPLGCYVLHVSAWKHGAKLHFVR